MRSEDQMTDLLHSYVIAEDQIAPDHPLRPIRFLMNDALKALDADFTALCAQDTPPPADRAGTPIAGDAAAGELVDPVGAPADGAAGV